jgi:hypothetical protein
VLKQEGMVVTKRKPRKIANVENSYETDVITIER